MDEQPEIHEKSVSEKVEERREAADQLEICFASLKDKKQAWEDLRKLMQDKNDGVRRGAAYALGAAYSHIPDEHKQQAWEDLHRLTSDNDGDVRASAYHSLGKASIFRATNAENYNNFKKLMEETIGYFEKSTLQEAWSEPAKFCLPYLLRNMLRSIKKEGTIVISDFEKPFEQERDTVTWNSTDIEMLLGNFSEAGMSVDKKQADQFPDLKISWRIKRMTQYRNVKSLKVR